MDLKPGDFAEVEMFGEKFRIGKAVNGKYYVNFVDENDEGVYYLRKDAYIRHGCAGEDDDYPDGWFDSFEDAVKTLDVYAERRISKKTGVPVKDATFSVSYVKN